MESQLSHFFLFLFRTPERENVLESFCIHIEVENYTLTNNSNWDRAREREREREIGLLLKQESNIE